MHYSYRSGVPNRWDTWGLMMEKISTKIPLMTAVGNHELHNGENYIAYKVFDIK